MRSGGDEFLAEIARHLEIPSLELHLDPKWGASAPHFRDSLYGAIQARLTVLQKHQNPTPLVADSSSSVEPALLSSGEPHGENSFYRPDLIEGGLDFSVSHASDLGGFAYLMASPKAQIGFDLEVIERVKPTLARRVCAEEAEFTRAPSPAALWTAKEAAFKALKGPLQPKTVSELEITSWRTDSQFEIFHFSLRQNLKILKTRGLSWTKDVHQFAIALVFHP